MDIIYKHIDPLFVQALYDNLPEDDRHLDAIVSSIAFRLASFPINPLVIDSLGTVRYSENWVAYYCSSWPDKGWFDKINQAYKELIAK
jgi:hypothetical protein